MAREGVILTFFSLIACCLCRWRVGGNEELAICGIDEMLAKKNPRLFLCRPSETFFFTFLIFFDLFFFLCFARSAFHSPPQSPTPPRTHNHRNTNTQNHTHTEKRMSALNFGPEWYIFFPSSACAHHESKKEKEIKLTTR